MKSIKTIVAGSAAVILGFALVASAASYTFTNYLSVGSTGADVSALQNFLMANGYNIAALASGAAQPGYFGTQTQAAVKAYQAAKGIPSTGFVGPLTVASLNNKEASGQGGGTVSLACPAGFTCTPIVAVNTTCPANTTCTPIGTTPGTMGTPGVAGILSASLWSSPSGVSVYKGQAYDVASYKLQAGASDMAVSGFTFDFNNYIWLYAGAITLKDETGAVVGTVSNLSASSFVELTAGSDYRITVPASFVVKAAQSKYITVNMSFLPSSDRCPSGSCALNILGASVRSVDGTGVTDTEPVLTARSFTYQGSNIGQINVKSDSNQPTTGNVQISTSVNTNNVLLGIYDIKSANVNSTMQSLAVNINTNSSVSNIFGTISISAAGNTYSASLLCAVNTTCTSATTNSSGSSTTAYFTSLVIPLSADVWTPVSVYANVNADTSGRAGGSLNGLMASTSLVAAGTAGASGNNPSVIDNSYNTLVVNTITPNSNTLTFTDSGVSQSNLTVNPATVVTGTGVSSSQVFTFTYSLTAGNNPIFVDATYANAVTAATTGGVWSNVSFRDSDPTGDTTSGGSAHFYVDAGNTKTFTVQEKMVASPGGSGTYSITALKYGTGWSGSAVTGAGSLSAPTIGNTLYATASF